MSGEPLRAMKIGSVISVSDELMQQAEEDRESWRRWVNATPAERAAWVAEADARVAGEFSIAEGSWDRTMMAARDDSIIEAVLRMHRPKLDNRAVKCVGCPDDNEYGPQDWPCATFSLVADELGLDLPL